MFHSPSLFLLGIKEKIFLEIGLFSLNPDHVIRVMTKTIPLLSQPSTVIQNEIGLGLPQTFEKAVSLT